MMFVEALIGAVTIKSIDDLSSRRRFNGILSPAPQPAAVKKEKANMAYGLDPRLFVENGPAIHAAAAHSRSSATAFRAWAGLDAERRLALVEKALRPAANDSVGLPIAL